MECAIGWVSGMQAKGAMLLRANPTHEREGGIQRHYTRNITCGMIGGGVSVHGFPQHKSFGDQLQKVVHLRTLHNE